MWWFIILVIIGVFSLFSDNIITLIYYCFHHADEDYHISPYEDGGTPLELNFTEDYRHFHISGLKHHVNENNWGTFNGYAIAEINNPYDSNAIAIYENNGILLGYVPKGKNKTLHKYILNHGGKSHAYGFVRVYHGQISGEVCVRCKNGVKGPNMFPINRDYINFDGKRPEYNHIVNYYYHSSEPIRNIKFPQQWINKKIYFNRQKMPFFFYNFLSWIEDNDGLVSCSLDDCDIIINFDNELQLFNQNDIYKNKLVDGNSFFEITETKYTVDKIEKWS